ncbi:MAG: gamma carbonic anhydrase family protein [Candidatus Methanoperedens sp.]|nr:gamma carbonic anhydrase family protein [Candidatus Methanoperedens sp.]MCE8427035.1 gamma carbonic anhydrase family protein [Candidatus Methanoperedens sp.]
MFFSFGDKRPSISKKAFIADTACIVGDVSIGEWSSVWFNSVIRGDKGRISIGSGSNIQDNAVIHTDDINVAIGDGVIIGHGCVMHGRLIGNNALIGMNSTILHGALIGEFAIVGAGALVPPDYNVPANSVVMGVPCKIVRETSQEEMNGIKNSAKEYEQLAEKYHKGRS